MEIPTARLLKENTYRLGAGQIYPYRYYYVALSPFKWMEFDGRITEIMGVAALGSGYGNYKDKAFDVKFRLLEEGMYTPQIALGIMDPQGTRKYPSQYIVASKQIYPFDFTIGFGNGRFGKVPLASSDETFKAEIVTDPMGWLKDSQFFGGIQFSPSEKYSFMVEYNPIRYEKQTADPAQAVYFQKAVPSKLNFGFRWKPFKWSEIDVTYQRGNEVGVSVSTLFELGKPLIPIYDPPYKEKKEDVFNPLEERLEKALRASGFRNVGVRVSWDSLKIEAENEKYFYAPRAISVILRLVAGIAPKRIEKIDIVLTQYGIPLLEFSTLREDISELYREKLTRDEFLFLSDINTKVYKSPDMDIKYRKWIEYGLKPSFETLLNDPNHFFMYRLGLAGWINLHPWEGLSLIAGLEVYPLNTVKSSVEPIDNPVRSDIFLYKDKNVNMSRLMAEQLFKTDHEVYGKVAAGYLEVEYAGVDVEFAKPLLDGRILIGVGGSAVRKRDPDNVFRLREDMYTKVYNTAFFNTRLNLPEIDMWFDVKTGRFLGGDIGSVVTVGKNINGLLIYGWYSFTNTNVFTDQYNRGYHDKGIGVSIPMRLFDGTDSKTAYAYSVSPWTRDVGQDIYHFTNLFDFIGRNLKVYWERDGREMK